MLSPLYLALNLLPVIIAAPSSPRQAGPSVELSYATVVGSSILGVDSFKAIPYAQPPVGQLRLKPPQPITSNLGTLVLPPIAQACPQFFIQVDSTNLPADVLGLVLDTPLGQDITDAGEDCLTLNVQRPSTATKDSKLPVVFWIFGGGFEFGSTQTYDATELIQNSVLQKKDIIYVAVNYRIGGFGFLPGSEILADGSANLGLLDQRLALQWVADNIAQFGGDPDKVTIWGESAGSISVFDQMALFGGNYTYKGNNLFRAAIMDSGSVIPTQPIDSAKGQAIYDTVVRAAGCSGSADTLDCLRSVDYQTYLNAANSVPEVFSFTSLDLSYLPRPDGTVLEASPDEISASGRYASIPFIIGDQEDEGTLFSLFQENITTTDELITYLNTIFFTQASRETITDFVNLYPDDPSAGSPFRTGELNNIYPQYKRVAALLGDLTFTLARRSFLNSSNSVHPDTPTYSYLASYLYGTPILGTFHATDILQAYGYTPDFASQSIQSYYISFINDLNPNGGNQINWPEWSQGNMLVNFEAASNQLIPDTFRQSASDFLSDGGLAQTRV